jgi:uncharacterized damage-inducible protein DinB
MREQLQRIEALRDAVLAEVAAAPDTQRRHRPTPDAWSALEVLEHLVLAERVVLGPSAQWRDRPSASRSLRDRVRYHMVRLVLQQRIKVRTPSEQMRPSGRVSFTQLRTAWMTQQEALREFVLSLDAAGARRAIFHHPIAGPLTVRQALQLLEVHLRGHAAQVHRLLNDAE